MKTANSNSSFSDVLRDASAELGKASIEQRGRDYVVFIPVSDGRAEFHFTEISRTPQALNVVISVYFHNYSEGSQPSFTQRINLQSASAITDLRRSLDDAYGKQYRWAILLNTATNALRSAFQAEQKPINVGQMEFATDTFLIKPFLQKDVSNMVFGDSEVGKTYFCMRLAISLALGIEFMGYESPKGVKTLFLDYEDSISTFNNRLFEISAGLGFKKEDVSPFLEWYKPDGSIRDIAETIARFVVDHGYGLIVIDAGSNAAGGSPNDEQKVVDMFNALEVIPCTKLIIHHEPKNTLGVADNKAYYGTTFWRALTRVAWRLTLENEEDGKLIKAVIAKKSNLGRVEPFMYRQKWDWGGLETSYEPCYFEVVEMEKRPSGAAQIIECLQENGQLTSSQIRQITGMGEHYFKEISQQMRAEKTILAKGIGRGAFWVLPPIKDTPPLNRDTPPDSQNTF